VVSELKVVSQVNHLGAAMVPNVIPVAIWLGAGIAVFLIRGRYIALLALQISASGGVVPIELSSEFFSTLSPWLPMTWVVQGLKAAMFSAYAGDWLRPLIQTLALTVICALITMAVGRWQYCRVSRLRPMLDL
jgi:putative membrane protein